MIVAEYRYGNTHALNHVYGLANRGSWFGETWAIVFNEGLCVVVEAGNAQDAVDELMDSHLGHLIRMDEKQVAERIADLGEDSITYAGNYSEPAFLDDIALIVRCKVHYFVNRELFLTKGRLYE